MGKVILKVADYSLDGIIGAEDTAFFEFCRAVPDDPEHEAWTRQSLERADVHVMGRVTYQGMAEYFPTAADHPYAEIMNKAPKVVFSRTLRFGGWANASVSGADPAEQLGRLSEGEVLAHGGISFARYLVRHDLADEYRLSVFPYLAGSGTPLFGAGGPPRELELVSSTAFGNGVAGLVYRRRR
jgi:dihydrofolate reductase